MRPGIAQEDCPIKRLFFDLAGELWNFILRRITKWQGLVHYELSGLWQRIVFNVKSAEVTCRKVSLLKLCS